MSAIEMARWINLSGASIKFVRGVSGVPWPGCDSEPGGIVEGPANYGRLFRDAGYTLLTAEMQAQIEAAERSKAEPLLSAQAPAPQPTPQPEPPTPQPDVDRPAPVIRKDQRGQGRGNRN